MFVLDVRAQSFKTVWSLISSVSVLDFLSLSGLCGFVLWVVFGLVEFDLDEEDVSSRIKGAMNEKQTMATAFIIKSSNIITAICYRVFINVLGLYGIGPKSV